MNSQQELELVANWVEPEPKPIRNFHSGHLPVTSEKGWWIWFTDKWLPNKDPRTDIKAAMEVALVCTNKLRVRFPASSFEWDLREIEDRSGDGELKILYSFEIVEDGTGFDGDLCIGEEGDTPEQAIFEAVVELIKYLASQKQP